MNENRALEMKFCREGKTGLSTLHSATSLDWTQDWTGLDWNLMPCCNTVRTGTSVPLVPANHLTNQLPTKQCIYKYAMLLRQEEAAQQRLVSGITFWRREYQSAECFISNHFLNLIKSQDKGLSWTLSVIITTSK